MEGTLEACLNLLREKISILARRCPSDLEIGNICTDKSCQAENSLFCDDDECPSCSEKHLGHSCLRLKVLKKLMEKKNSSQRKFLE